MLEIREAFPDFEKTWTAHLAYWNREPAGAFMDISEFAHFVDDEFLQVANYD